MRSAVRRAASLASAHDVSRICGRIWRQHAHPPHGPPHSGGEVDELFTHLAQLAPGSELEVPRPRELRAPRLAVPSRQVRAVSSIHGQGRHAPNAADKQQRRHPAGSHRELAEDGRPHARRPGADLPSAGYEPNGLVSPATRRTGGLPHPGRRPGTPGCTAHTTVSSFRLPISLPMRLTSAPRSYRKRQPSGVGTRTGWLTSSSFRLARQPESWGYESRNATSPGRPGLEDTSVGPGSKPVRAPDPKRQSSWTIG